MAGATSTAAGATAQIDYGLDGPQLTRAMFSRAAWTFGFALVLYFINHVEYPGPAARLAGAITLIAAIFFGLGWWRVQSSRVGKMQLRDQLVDSLALEGSEKVLDVGCGRGLLTIGIAQRLKSGRVIGLGNWLPEPKHDTELSGNSAEAARENAKAAGVVEKLRFEGGDLLKLTYPEGHFDVVTSFLAVHTLPEAEERAQALREMVRVLKPGGKLVLHDVGPVEEYPAVLKECGAKEVVQSAPSYLWAARGLTISAVK